jgi:hypothetical protein
MLKALIWCLTAVGLIPALCLACTGGLSLIAQHQVESGLRGTIPSGREVFRHDSYAFIQIGPARISFYPRCWAVVVLLVGILLVVVALFVTLHVSYPDLGQHSA